MADTDAFERMERDGWGNPDIAKGYADGFDRASRQVAAALAEVAAPGADVLDLCTGHGVVAAACVAKGAQVTGLDFSEAMITLARQNVPEATFVHGDAMQLSYDADSFDAVTIGFGVPHFPDPARGLAEAARVLRPGGQIAFSIWYGKGSPGAFGWLFDAVGRLGDSSVTLPPGPDAHWLTDRDVATRMVTQAGFRDVAFADLDTDLWVRTPEALFDVFAGGAVRAASLLSGQPTDRRDAIRADLAARVLAQGRAEAGGHLVPAPSLRITATAA